MANLIRRIIAKAGPLSWIDEDGSIRNLTTADITGPQGPAGEPATNLIQSVNGQTGHVSISADDVGAATLANGKVPSSQIPDMAVTATKSVSDRAGMLALDAERNDLAIVAEDEDGESRTYVLLGDDPSSFSDWVVLSSPGNVTSVNSQVGVVNLSASDVSAMAALGPGAQSRVPITSSSGSETSAPVGTTLINNGIVQRTGSGQAVVADASAANHAATLGQVQKPSTFGMTSPTGDYVLAKTNGADTWRAVGLASSGIGSTIMSRTSDGRARAMAGTEAGDVVNLAQLDTKLTAAVGGSTTRLYGINSAGNQALYQASSSGLPSTVVLLNGNGRAQVADGVSGTDLVNKAQLDTKISATTTPWVLHGTNGSGVEVEQAMGNTPSGNSVIRRDSGGRAQVTDGSSVQDIATVGQLNTKLSTVTPSNTGIASSDSALRIPVKNGSANTWRTDGMPVSATASNDSIMLRNSTGQAQVSAGTTATHAVNLSQLDGRLSAAQRAAIDALPASGATVDQVVAALRAS